MITVSEITVDDFKTWFYRDFSYYIPLGSTDPVSDCYKDYVTDQDITKAYTEAKMNFNEGLFGDDDSLKTAFLYISAHYLCNDIQASSEGITSTGYFTVSSRSVGSVSEAYDIPAWMKADSNLSYFTTTRYGQKYLSLIKPLLIGNVAVYQGATTYR
jgi:hypothetical protein